MLTIWRWQVRGAVFGLVLLLAAAGGAQEVPSPFEYDPGTVETHQGLVVSVSPPAPGPIPQMVTVQLATPRETLTIWLAPTWFLEARKLKIAALDRIEVTGSRLVRDGKPLILAATVRKGDMVLRLRDAAGRPLWGGRADGNR